MASTDSDDVFSSTQPAIVDFDVLEASKENVQPLAHGRRVTALSALLATPHAQREARLAATRKRLRINIEIALEDEDEDPLEAYFQLVQWTVENYPQGQSVDSGLVELLEESTRVLKDHRDGAYKQDIRYLKLWMMYTFHVDRPTIIYHFLLANEIGTDHALLYEEFAAVLERDGRRKDADEMYVLGINRRAQPLDSLKKRHQEFQKRMMVLPPVPATDSQIETPAASKPNPTTSKRPILGAKQARTAPPPSGSTTTRRAAASPVVPNGRIEVFADSEESPPDTFQTNAYPEIGTRVSRIKENKLEKKSMAGSTIKQKGKAKRAAIAAVPSRIQPFEDPDDEADGGANEDGKMTERPNGFAVFQDEDNEEDDALSPSSPTHQPELSPLTSKVPALGPRGDEAPIRSSEAEALRKNPLKNYGLDSSVN
ncbi:other/BUB protein kinase [Flagelloscypha sp. PMI_526]|nr:other/BUB protein kinase [Flagelloscypha sp. PMI_526]